MSTLGSHSRMLYLPDTMKNWPWKRAINPLYEEVKSESNAWFESFKAFTPKSLQAFKRCDFPRLAALAYPRASREHLRVGCDLMNLFFVVDEYTDVEPASVVREMVDVMIDALNNPHIPRPKGEIILGEITRQFWERGTKVATLTAQRHMIESFTAYLESLVQQATDRDNNSIRNVDEYLHNRRENIGARPSYVPMELDLNLVDEVFYHPVLAELSVYITDILILDNDIISYNKEQATGDDRHNILTIAMHQFNIDVEGAMTWVTEYHTELETKFMDGMKRLPSWGLDMDRQVQQYLYGLGNWPRGNDCWGFESGRYLGSRGLEIQKSRLVSLYPKVASTSHSKLRRENVVIHLIDELSAVA